MQRINPANENPKLTSPRPDKRKETTEEEEKKTKRKMQNQKSARVSRERQKQKLHDLQAEVTRLTLENDDLKNQLITAQGLLSYVILTLNILKPQPLPTEEAASPIMQTPQEITKDKT